MGNLTAANIWAIVAGVAAAVVLLVNAWEKLVTVIHAVKAPGAAQNDRLAQLEDDMDQIKTYLSNDKRRIDALAEGDKVTKQALLALLGHGIDGNNVDAMIKSKDDLEKYLIKNI